MQDESSYADDSSSSSGRQANRRKCMPSAKRQPNLGLQLQASSSQDQDNNVSKKESKLVCKDALGYSKQVRLPQNISINSKTAYDLTSIPKTLKMLFIDVLCRGFHLSRGFMQCPPNKFSYDEGKEWSEHVELVYLPPDQAMGEIWRCVARQLGRPYKEYDFKRVKRQLDGIMEKIEEKSQIQKFEKIQLQPSPQLLQYNTLEEKMDTLKKKITGKLEQIQRQINVTSDAERRRDQMIAVAMKDQILKLEKQIFIRTVITIRKAKTNPKHKVQLILEQPYPHITWDIEKAQHLLGAAVYQSKIDAYYRYEKMGFISSNQKADPIIICHRCLQPLNRNGPVERCSGEKASLIVHGTVLTDPFIYTHQVMQESIGEKPVSKFIHPYLVYYLERPNDRNPTSKALCNRYYCAKCKEYETELHKTGVCKYCGGDCNCFRCSGMDTLTKMMSLYLDRGGDWSTLVSQFLFVFDSKTLATDRKSSHLAEKPEEHCKRMIKSFMEDNIFMKADEFKQKEKSKIVYFTKNVSNYDCKALAYVQKKQREREIRLKPSRDTIEERKDKRNLQRERQKQLLAALGDDSEQPPNNNKDLKKQKKAGRSSSEKQAQDIFFEDEDS